MASGSGWNLRVWLVGVVVGGIYGCGEQEAGVASGSGWNLWVCLLGVVVRRYKVYRFPHTTYPYSSCIYLFFFCSSIPTFCSFLKI